MAGGGVSIKETFSLILHQDSLIATEINRTAAAQPGEMQS